MTGGAGVEGEESNLPVLVTLLPRRFRRGVDRVPLAWTRRLPRPAQLHHLFQAVQALHHGNSPFKKKADATDPSYGSPSLAGAQAIGEAKFSGGYCMWPGPSRPCRSGGGHLLGLSRQVHRAVGVYRDVVNGPRVAGASATLWRHGVWTPE